MLEANTSSYEDSSLRKEKSSKNEFFFPAEIEEKIKKDQYLSTNFEDFFFNKKETYIHPSAIIGKNVKLDTGVKIGPFSIIIGNVTIGKNSIIYGNCSIGMPAQNIGIHKNFGHIQIGENCHIREFVTIGSSKKEQDGVTIIGNNCYIMNYTHIAHDVTLEENVTLINNVNLAGHVYIENNVIISAFSGVHQFCKIGAYSILAPYSGTRQDLPPYAIFNESPAKYFGINKVGLTRNGFTAKQINAIKHITTLFYQQKQTFSKMEEIAKSQNWWGEKKIISRFLDFIKNSKRGVSRKSALD